MNKQGNIDLAIISKTSGVQQSKKFNDNILDMVGDIGSVTITEKKTFENEDKFENQKDKPKIPIPSIDDGGFGNKNDTSEFEVTSSISEEKLNLEVEKGEDSYKNFTKNKNEQDDNFKYNPDFSHLKSNLDNSADTSDFQKWKLNKRASLDQPLPDLSNVKSKINTGISQKKVSLDSHLKNETDELKKKFESLQKEKENKLKDYREMLLKMQREKNSDNDKKEVSELKIKYFSILL